MMENTSVVAWGYTGRVEGIGGNTKRHKEIFVRDGKSSLS